MSRQCQWPFQLMSRQKPSQRCLRSPLSLNSMLRHSADVVGAQDLVALMLDRCVRRSININRRLSASRRPMFDDLVANLVLASLFSSLRA